jgi:hypothetical protein
MIISGAAIHCDGHGKCGLLVAQTFLQFLAGLAAFPPPFYRHLVSTNLTGISLINFYAHALLRVAMFPAQREIRKEGLMKVVIGAFLIGSALCCLALVSVAAQTAWVDEINNSLAFSTANYPSMNWEPYQQKLRTVREAVDRGDNQAVKSEMGKWFKMLRSRDNGISDVAADELYNFSLMVTPVQEYGIAVPAGPVGLGETNY